VRAARPDHAAQQGATLRATEGGGLDGVLLLLAGDDRLAAGAVGAGAADLHFGAVDAQVNALRVGVGEQVLQRPQPHPGRPGRRNRGSPAAAGPRGSLRRRWSGPPRTVQPARSAGSQAAGGPAVTKSRSTKTRRCLGPAPAALLRSPPRRSGSADSRAVCHRGAGSSSNWPKCACEMPDRAGWEQAARAQASRTTHPTRTAVLMSRVSGTALLIVF
jgi:hypothetical protein